MVSAAKRRAELRVQPIPRQRLLRGSGAAPSRAGAFLARSCCVLIPGWLCRGPGSSSCSGVRIVPLSSRAAAGGINPRLLTLDFLSARRFRNVVARSVACQLGFAFASSRLVVPARVVTNKTKAPPLFQPVFNLVKSNYSFPSAAPCGAGFGQFCPRPVSPRVLGQAGV